MRRAPSRCRSHPEHSLDERGTGPWHAQAGGAGRFPAASRRETGKRGRGHPVGIAGETVHRDLRPAQGLQRAGAVEREAALVRDEPEQLDKKETDNVIEGEATREKDKV